MKTPSGTFLSKYSLGGSDGSNGNRDWLSTKVLENFLVTKQSYTHIRKILNENQKKRKHKFSIAFLVQKSLKHSLKILYFKMVIHSMGDGSQILPAQVHKIIPTLLGMSWVSRDQKFNVKYKCIGFLVDFSVILV